MNSLPNQPCGDGAGVLNFAAIGRRVAAIYASPGEIDDDIRAVDAADPIAQFLPVPSHALPLGRHRVACDDSDPMPALVEMAGEYVSYVARSSRYHDAKRRDRGHWEHSSRSIVGRPKKKNPERLCPGCKVEMFSIF